ncbi:MAG TPA: MFS transporter, partial [Opitutaceae bacterium]|nr:MFS transporter [Opitutaceae bacterium]
MAPLLATAVRKSARRLVPFLLLLYVLAFLDRVNIGYARQAFLRDTGLGEEAYAFGAGVFFVAYALLEIPSNMVLVRVGARAWIGATMIAWGVISAAMMLAWSAPVFYSLRFLLGAAEAGFFPGMIWYLGSWFPAPARGGMFGIFYFGAPLAQIFGGPLSGLLLEMNGRGALRGWQWMFLVEGALAVLVGAWTCTRLPNSVANAHWLSAGERGALQAELGAEEPATDAGEKGSLRGAGRGRAWRLGIIYALIQMSFYGVAFYLPSQVSGLLGRSIGLFVGLVSSVPWICALAAAYAVPRLAARIGRGGATAGASLVVGAVGIALSATHNPALGLTGLCLAAAGLIGAQPIFWTFPAGVFAGRGAAAR